MGQRAFIIGSTGLVGSQLLRLLCNSPEFDAITILVRKPSGFHHHKVQEYVVDFNNKESYAPILKGDVFFCCIGTTQKQTPNRDLYYTIDHDYPVNFAQAAYEAHFSQYHFISAIGADANARNFYLKTKGQAERDLLVIPFKGMAIYRPSIIVGSRTQKRPLETLASTFMKLFNPLLIGSWRKYRSIEALTIAKAMLHQAEKGAKASVILESDAIEALGSTT
jgi:uncharacterized protein YbjT (DUF2867 family)